MSLEEALARDFRRIAVSKARADFWAGLRFAYRFDCHPPAYVHKAREILDGAGEPIHTSSYPCPCGGTCAG